MVKNAARLFSSMVVFSVLMGSSPTYAESLSFGCDTATGRFSPVRIPLNASQLTVTGSIKPVLFRKDKKWLPTAFVRIEDNEKHSITVRLSAENSKAAAADAMIVVRNGDDRSEGIVGSVALDTALQFSISYGENADVAIVVDGKTVSVPNQLGEEVTLSLICSTGDFIFDEIAWSTSQTK